MQAMSDETGSIAFNIVFTRVPWNETVAAEFRVAPLSSPQPGAQLEVLDDYMVDENAFVYRYFTPGAILV
jgi:hypothetical protein